MIPNFVRDVLHQLFNFVQRFWKVRLSSGDLREFLENLLRLLGRGLLKQAAPLVIVFKQADRV